MWGNTWEPPSVLRAPKGVDTPGLATADGHDVVPAIRPPSASDLDEIPEQVIDLADRFLRLPRHLGIHSGGMVMCDRPVIEVCPVEWARMPGRTVLQWDKEDCADAGLVKFDLLGLGMLTALRIGFGFVQEHEGRELDLHGLPAEDPRVYDLLSAADTVGVFQVESRAQMGTLPRLQPRTFYDIVIEVALIRPGPIQGGSVHPYIERAHGRQPVTYLHPLLEKSLAKTKGVPLFQEQLMQMAIDVADFTPAEADQLRRAMGSKRSTERMEAMRDRLMSGMAGHGIDAETGEQIFDKLKAFADFGFPESHAYSFAFLVYASAWLKVYHPAAFYAGLLAAQPMGFYSPQSLAADARRHGLEVLRPDVQSSDVQACVERLGPHAGRWRAAAGADAERDRPGHRAGGAHGRRWRGPSPSGSGSRPCGRWGRTSRSGWSTSAARTGRSPTCGSWCGGCSCRPRSSRPSPPPARSTAWTSRAGRRCGRPARSRRRGRTRCRGSPSGCSAPMLPGLSDVEIATADVWATGVSVDSYPTQFVRDGLDAAGVLRVEQAYTHEIGRRVAVAGVVTHRQRPGHGGRDHVPVPRGRDRAAQRHLLGRAVAEVPQGRPHVTRARGARPAGAVGRCDQPGRRAPDADVAEGPDGVAGLPVTLRAA